MASKASLADQQKQVQENIHSQIKGFCTSMDEVLLPNIDTKDEPLKSTVEKNTTQRSGLSLAVGINAPSSNHFGALETNLLKHAEVSQKMKDLMGYTLDLRPSQIPHKEAGQGLFLNGEASVGTVIAFYPGIIYSPAYYRYIPGYPRVDAHNSYLITRYDGTVINAQPWGAGGENREVWNGSCSLESQPNMEGADRIWKLLSKPLDGTQKGRNGDILERRNPLAFAHFANHPDKGMAPNVMVCPYDFPLTEKDMRTYIPNILFGGVDEIKMKRYGSFWFKSGSSGHSGDSPIMKTLVLLCTRTLCNEEVFLNYRLSNSKRRPSWYIPVDEEEDRRRWS